MSPYQKGIKHTLIFTLLASTFAIGAAAVTFGTDPMKDTVVKFYASGVTCTDKYYPVIYCRSGMDGVKSPFGRNCVKIDTAQHDRFRAWLGTMYPAAGGDPVLGGALNEWWPVSSWVLFMRKFGGQSALTAADQEICNSQIPQ